MYGTIRFSAIDNGDIVNFNHSYIFKVDLFSHLIIHTHDR
jgi:hypothetical protein